VDHYKESAGHLKMVRLLPVSGLEVSLAQLDEVIPLINCSMSTPSDNNGDDDGSLCCGPRVMITRQKDHLIHRLFS